MKVFLVTFLILICSNPSISKELIWATDDTPGEPYIIGGGNKFHWEKPGIEIEIYKLLEKKLNLKIKFVRLPWKRCLNKLQRGEVDAIFASSFKSSRMEMGVYPMRDGVVDPNKKSRDGAYYLYKLKSSSVDWNGTKFKNFSKKRNKGIGAPLGWSIIDKLKEHNLKVVEKSSLTELLNMLLRGGIAGVACLETALDHYIRNQPNKYKNIVKVSPAIWKKPYYLMLSHQFVKKNPILSQKIWDTIEKIQKSKEYKKILSKYQREIAL